ncbi:MAG: fused MFS/spermidine synthase [Rhodovarius sp.]|nr:fused MFS/spermidine synthase [Rhodovarius sp.]MDW8315971.1 fused MFS/spermidine synthase [Rhodovarius sp.]
MPRLMVAFFCSGFAALLCQIVWQRMLGVFAGGDTVSAALVVGAFLAGLGLGSIIGARIADRLSPYRALLGFAVCEAGVALCALVSKPFLYDFLAIGLADQVQAPAAVFALCFAALVIPTTLMGASLPLLARAITTSLETAAQRIGALYGLNTLGAGLGALLGGWFILGNVGFVGALWVAAALDALAALLALTLLPAMSRAAPAGPPAARPVEAYGPLPLWCLLVFLSGYVIVALEILWVRLLGQVGQYHAYLFPTVLGVFLLADGAGMWLAARLVRRIPDPRPAFFYTQGAGFVLGTALILLMWWHIDRWPLDPLLAVDFLRFGPEALAASSLLVLLLVAPPAFLIGMTFPFVQRAVQQDLSSVGARVGWVQLANILGNAAGSILTGLVTLHILGSMGTLLLLSGLSIALLIGWYLRQQGPGRRITLGLVAATAALALMLPSNARFWQQMHGHAEGSYAAWAEDRSGIAFYRTEPEIEGRERGRFFIMGHGQGYVPFLDIHMLLGVLGPLIHPNPERVLTIGIGSGGTPYGATVSPATREIRAIELVRPVIDTLEDMAQAQPHGPVATLLRDPRVRLEYGDGRRALMRGDDLYDVIEADAILPESSQSGLLYSAEFLQTVRQRLAPGGIYVQWAPTWRVVDTFASVFPYAILLRPASIMLGSDRPIPFDQQALMRRLRDPDLRRFFEHGNPRAADMAEAISHPVEVWTPATPRVAPPLTDMFPRDEFFWNQPITHTWQPRPPPETEPMPPPVPEREPAFLTLARRR